MAWLGRAPAISRAAPATLSAAAVVVFRDPDHIQLELFYMAPDGDSFEAVITASVKVFGAGQPGR